MSAPAQVEPLPPQGPSGNGGPTVPLAEPRKPRCDPEAFYEPLTKILRSISAKRGKPLFALITEHIDDETLKTVFSWRKELCEAGRGDSFDVVIHSPGGQLTNCYMLARLLCRFAEKWDAIVPEIASSGATMICLGSSNIVMSEMAQLGPLDPQVISKKREKFFASERQSPLEAFEALRYLREFAASSVDALMVLFTDRGIAPEKALETSAAMATNLVRPVLEKIDPYDLGAFSLDNRLAGDYCEAIAKPSGSNQTQRKALFKSLVEDYPAHEFAIDFAEAQTLRLNVAVAPTDLEDLFDKFRTCATRVRSYLGLVPMTAVKDAP